MCPCGSCRLRAESKPLLAEPVTPSAHKLSAMEIQLDPGQGEGRFPTGGAEKNEGGRAGWEESGVARAPVRGSPPGDKTAKVSSSIQWFMDSTDI